MADPEVTVNRVEAAISAEDVIVDVVTEKLAIATVVIDRVDREPKV